MLMADCVWLCSDWPPASSFNDKDSLYNGHRVDRLQHVATVKEHLRRVGTIVIWSVAGSGLALMLLVFEGAIHRAPLAISIVQVLVLDTSSGLSMCMCLPCLFPSTGS